MYRCHLSVGNVSLSSKEVKAQTTRQVESFNRGLRRRSDSTTAVATTANGRTTTTGAPRQQRPRTTRTTRSCKRHDSSEQAVRTMRHCSGCKSTRLRKYSLTPQMHASCRSCNKGTRSVQPSLCWQKNPLRFPNRIGVSKIRKQACKTKMMMKKNKGRATAPTVEETHPSAASSSESAFASSPTMEQGNVGTGCGDFPEADVRTD